MERICANGWCQQTFEVTDDDLVFLDKVAPVFNGKKEGIPPPTLCPPCRMQRRLSWRNERTLYRRTCDATGESIVSIHHSDVPFPVYKNSVWWSDNWDPKDFGRDVDLSRSFLEQFVELRSVVPKPARTTEESSMVNSDFCNENAGLKDCYLCFEGGGAEQCLYCRGFTNLYRCVDCLNCTDCNSCYECIGSHNCYASRYLQDCRNCSDSILCTDCQDCRNCLGCVNMRSKEYCLWNAQLTKEEYEKQVADLLAERSIGDLREQFATFRSTQIARPTHQLNTENCRGDYLLNCKNCDDCFSCAQCEDCRYCDSLLSGGPNRDSMDVSHFGIGVELSYECQCIGGMPGVAFHNLFCDSCWPGANLLYCHYCVLNTQDCFGCIGLKKAQYCILNKQYTKEEYEQFVPRIIERMRQDDEWGQFFPVAMSLYGYNATVANEHFPLMKEECIERGWQWRELENLQDTGGTAMDADVLPPRIADVSDDILNRPIRCSVTGRPFKIIKQELEFYRQFNVPLPRFHPDERYRRRMALRNPRKLWKRGCMKCGKGIMTSYAPDRTEIVYCEECYLRSVY